MSDLARCPWAASGGAEMLEYHDRQWGVPVHDDRELFEMLTLEGAQAGLSWSTVLKRRQGYRRAFADFDPSAVARFGDADRERLLADPGIIRNRAKVDSAIANARAFLEIQREFGAFDRFLWDSVPEAPKRNRFRRQSELPADTEASRQLSRSLRERGFSFVGPTIVYAYMQAVGMVNDHLVDCFRYDQV